MPTRSGHFLANDPAERVPGCEPRIGSGALGRADYRLRDAGRRPEEHRIRLGAQTLPRIAPETPS